MPHFLALSGSIRKSSSNSILLQALKNHAPEPIHIEIWEGLESLPHFNPDLDHDGQVPEAVLQFRGKIQAAQAVILCTPEYAAGVPGAFKNALDWLVGSGDLADKPVAAISASPYPTAGEQAHHSLMLTLGMLGARVPEGAQLKVGLVNKKLSPEGSVLDEVLQKELQEVLLALHSAVLQPQG